MKLEPQKGILTWNNKSFTQIHQNVKRNFFNDINNLIQMTVFSKNVTIL